MLISEVPDYIKNNIKGDLSIKKLSRLCFMSASNFKIHFKNSFAEPIGKYVMRLKMYAALEKLTSGEYFTTKAVGWDMGYLNLSNFAKAFQKFHGYPPYSALVKKERYDKSLVKESDKHVYADSIIKQIATCPEKLQADFETHFGKPISALLLTRERV